MGMIDKPKVGNDNHPPAILQKRRSRWQKLRSGQSMVEFALSVTVLILIFSGAVDLGRAFFTRISMDSAISEAIHWAAAYPGCLTYGVAQNVQGTSNVPINCVGNNSIVGRMLAEGNQLDLNNIVDASIAYTPQNEATCGGTGHNRCNSLLSQLTPGDTVNMSMTYELTLITPLMRAMFGSTLELTAFAKEVVRGSGLPPTNGVAFPQPPNLNPADPVTVADYGENAPSASQVGYYGDRRCKLGLPTLRWAAKSATGYNIYPATNQIDPPTIDTVALSPADTMESPSGEGDLQTYVTDSSVVSNGTTTFFYPDATAQGYRAFSIKTVVGGTEASAGAVVTVRCPAVKVQTLTLQCNQTNTGAQVNYVMDTSSGLLDAGVTGYTLYRGSVGGTNVGTLPSDPNGAGSSTVTFAAPGDWLTGNYFLQAQSSTTTTFGLPNTIPAVLDCSYGTSSPVPVSVVVTDSAPSYIATAPATYTVTVTNNGTEYVRGLNVTGFDGTAAGVGPKLTSQQWTCTPGPSVTVGSNTYTPDCAGSSSSSVDSDLNGVANIPPGGYVTYTVTGYYPSPGVDYVVKATVAGPSLCGSSCQVNADLTAATDTDTVTTPPNADLYITDPTSTTTATYTSGTVGSPGPDITYTIDFGNTAASGTDVTGAQAKIYAPISNVAAGTTVTYQCANVGTATCADTSLQTMTATGNATITASSLPQGEHVTITITVSPATNEGFTLRGEILNWGGTSDTNGGYSVNAGNNYATRAYSSSTPITDLGITVAASATSQTFSSPGPVTYTIVAYNKGPGSITDAELDISASSIIDVIASGGSATLSCVAASGANCGTYNSSVTTDSISATGLVLPVGNLTAVTYTLTVNLPAVYQYSIVVTGVVTITTPSTFIDPVPASGDANTASVTTTSGWSSSIDATTTFAAGSATTYYPGDTINLLVSVKNNDKKKDITSAKLRLTDLNSALKADVLGNLVTFTCSSGCSISGSSSTTGNATTSGSFAVAAKQTATFTLTGTVKTTFTTSSTSFKIETLGISYTDSNPSDDSATTSVSFNGATFANIALSNTDNVAGYGAGTTLTYVVTVTNSSGTHGLYGAYMDYTINTTTGISSATITCDTTNSTATCPASLPSFSASGGSTKASGIAIDIGTGKKLVFNVTVVTASTAGSLPASIAATAQVFYFGTTGSSLVTDSGGAQSKSAVDTDASNTAAVIVVAETSSGTTYSLSPTTTPTNVTLTFTITNNATATSVTGLQVTDLLAKGAVAGTGSYYVCTVKAAGSGGTTSCGNISTTNTSFSFGAATTNQTPLGSGKTVNVASNGGQVEIKVVLAAPNTQKEAVSYALTAAVPSAYTEAVTTDNSKTATRTATLAAFTGTYACDKSGSILKATFTWPNQKWAPNGGTSIVKYEVANSKDSTTAIVTSGSAAVSYFGTTVKVTVGTSTVLEFADLNASDDGIVFKVTPYDPVTGTKLLTQSTVGTFVKASCT
jgi:hypothetical protein